MRTKEKELARQLRKEEGLSLLEIAKKLNVAKSSVSLWVRDIQLTEEQLNNLHSQNRLFLSQLKAHTAWSNICRKKRVEYQKKGIDLLTQYRNKEKGILLVSGCMLYWGEGRKLRNKNHVSLANSDPFMIKFFIRFLKECFEVKDEEIKIDLHCYDDINSVQDIEKYWLGITGLTIKALRKTQLNRYSKYSKKKCDKSPYGTCTITVHKTIIIQQIYGILQEYVGFEDAKWLG